MAAAEDTLVQRLDADLDRANEAAAGIAGKYVLACLCHHTNIADWHGCLSAASSYRNGEGNIAYALDRHKWIGQFVDHAICNPRLADYLTRIYCICSVVLAIHQQINAAQIWCETRSNPLLLDSIIGSGLAGLVPIGVQSIFLGENAPRSARKMIANTF